VTVVAGATAALLYSTFDFGIFLTSSWGLSILLGGAMGLVMYILHMTVEGFELKVLKTVDLDKAEEFPEELTILEGRVRMLPRVGFVILTVTILLMIYAAHEI
jgi:hypothetical protein